MEEGKSYYEFLIRMLGEDGEVTLPDAFIPAAERYNIMPELDRYMVDKTFAYIKNKVVEYSINPGSICFEITETSAITNLKLASEFIREVKGLGCYFALDGFGSGMSSFSYLNALPVDFIKIDGEFVKDMVVNPMNAAIVESINKIGHVAGMKIIGEYAENQETV